MGLTPAKKKTFNQLTKVVSYPSKIKTGGKQLMILTMHDSTDNSPELTLLKQQNLETINAS